MSLAAATGLIAVLITSLAASHASAQVGPPDMREAHGRIGDTVARSVVMVKVVAHPQMRLNGVNQPPRTFEREGPATVVATGGVVASALSLFDPTKGLPPREGLEFGATVYSSVKILLEGGDWIDGRMAGTSEDDDLIFFTPGSADDGARLPALTLSTSTDVALFAEYLDITRAPPVFDRCRIARVSAVEGRVPSGRFIFVTSLSLGSPVVDAQGVMLGLGVRVSSQGVAATSVLVSAPRVRQVAVETGLVPAAAAP